MAAFNLLAVDVSTGKPKRTPSNTTTIDFLSVKVGASTLEIKETSGNFDFGSVRLTAVADPVNPQDVVTKNWSSSNLANISLSNLGTTSINASLTPVSDNTLVIGTASFRWGAIRVVSVDAGASALSLNGTSVNVNSLQIKNLAAGTASTDAVNKSQLDAVSAGATALTLNHIYVGNSSNIATDVAMSGEASIISSGAVTLSNSAVIGKLLTGYVAGAGTVSASDSILQAIQKVDGNDALKIPLTQKGAANGVATLDAGQKIPVAQLPNSVMEFQGVWNASTNSPTLVDGTGNVGDVYRVNVAGTQNLGSGSQTFVVGDYAILDAGGIWRLAHSGADAVSSVNGAAGIVVVNAINQLTGDVTTSAASGSQSLVASLVATSNSTLTTISSLVSVGTITTGTWNATAISAAKGGTGGDSSAATGIAHVASGVWSYSQIVNADVSNSAAIAYSKLNLSNSIAAADITTGVFDQSTITGGNGTAASVSFAITKTNDNAGAITAGQIVYVKSNGNVDKALASTISYDTELGIVQAASIAAAGSGLIVFRRGAIVGGFSGLTPGKIQYVSRSTAGATTESLSGFVVGEQVYEIGRAVSTTQISYDPRHLFEF